MNIAQNLRQATRRGALVGARGVYSVSGATREAYAAPGIATLLLHESPEDDVERLLRHVRRHRDRYVDFAELDRLIDGEFEPSSTKITITFDDGLASNVMVARALAAEGVQACFYVPTDAIGMAPHEADDFFRRRPVRQRRYKASEPVMRWSDLEELVSLGHVVGSHCRQHVPLVSMGLAEAEDQVKGSLAVLRERLGDVRHFAWPFGGLGHAPVDDVVRWCADVGAVAASGVRGHNTTATYARNHYVMRDAVEYGWLATDLDVFFGRRAKSLGVPS